MVRLHFHGVGLFKNLFKIVTNRTQLWVDGERKNRSLHEVNENFENRPTANVSGAVDLEQVLGGQVVQGWAKLTDIHSTIL
jgi:hypothetical protein